MTRARDPLVRALVDPYARPATHAQWNDVLWRGRVHGLLGRLALHVEACGALGQAPPRARAQMSAALVASESSQTAVRFELNRVLRALDGVDAPLVLLKGAAYAMAGLPPARGRLIGDLDVMVEQSRLGDVERALVEAGWRAAPISEYDERFYREGSHEVPPLQHPRRETPVDLHHTIAPPRARVRVDAGALLGASVSLADARLRVLAPADMVLHSAYHLFNDEVGKPLRDLLDLHDLLTHFGKDPGFWDALAERARLHGLGRPAFHALRQTQRLIGTAVPPRAMATFAAFAPAAPSRAVMDALFAARFRSRVVDCAAPKATFAGSFFYVRAHWLRMPPASLARHLAIKAAARMRERSARSDRDAGRSTEQH